MKLKNFTSTEGRQMTINLRPLRKCYNNIIMRACIFIGLEVIVRGIRMLGEPVNNSNSFSER